MNTVTSLGVAALVGLGAANPRLTAVRRPIEWPAYANAAGGSKYSLAGQITHGHVGTLTTAGGYRTGDYGVGRVQARDETTPIFLDGVVYVSTPFAPDTRTGAPCPGFGEEGQIHLDRGLLNAPAYKHRSTQQGGVLVVRAVSSVPSERLHRLHARRTPRRNPARAQRPDR